MALDVTTQAQIVRQMMELRDDYGTGIIVVTHNLGVAAYMSDYIVVMKDGRIEDQGDREDVYKRQLTGGQGGGISTHEILCVCPIAKERSKHFE